MSRLATPAAPSDDAFASPLAESHSIPWDAHLQPTGMLYSPAARAAHAQALVGLYTLPPSPPHSVSSTGTRPGSPIAPAGMLKSRMGSPDAPEQTLCLPTHQVFDIPPGGLPVNSPSPSPSPSPSLELQESRSRERLSISINPALAAAVPAKRALSTASGSSSWKKPRAVTSTKDYVPPDVSGLSKREARLVKNRAAAFLSRQRKREEFENMEIRVAELEQENARLLALSRQAQPAQDEDLLSEMEQLRKQLAETQKRERSLAEELLRKQRSPSPAPSSTSSVKSEGSEPQLSTLRSMRIDRTGASFGLMVLLCALPTLLSMPSQSHSTLPSLLTMPLSHAAAALPSSALDMQPFMAAHSDFDWLNAMGSGSGTDFDLDMDVTKEDKMQFPPATAAAAPLSGSKLEFVNDEGDSSLSLGDLGALDISFDALPAENGKIRVRIHPPSASCATAPAAESPAASQPDEDHAMSISESSNAPSPASQDADALGPFLGTGSNVDFNALMMGLNREDELAGLDLDWDSLSWSFSRAGSPGASLRRRVRIALRSMPGEGREGGEWEVELC